MSDEAWVSWSCGKDSALALAKVRTGGGVVAGLLTTTVHGAEVAISRVPVELLWRQAVALGLPLEVVDLPWPCKLLPAPPRSTCDQSQVRRQRARWVALRADQDLIDRAAAQLRHETA